MDGKQDNRLQKRDNWVEKQIFPYKNVAMISPKYCKLFNNKDMTTAGVG